MKKILLLASVCAFVFFTSCNGGAESADTHLHDDGSVHDDHADTSAPVQQEFNVTDSTHSHDDSTHSHGDSSHSH